MIGEKIAHYKVLQKLGEGGMGQVFLAEDTRLDRKVALKILHDDHSGGQALRRFEREAKVVAALDHPNILAIHDYGREDPVTYVAMEYLEGRTLRDEMSSRLPLRAALGYCLDVVEGLAAAHDKGIYHRDLKPENIFVTKDSRIKILDFGLAKVQDPTLDDEIPDGDSATVTRLTNPGVVMGTAGYMSPEQVRGLPVDHRSDLFSFGSILFELVTGERAFQEESPVETMHAILKQEPNVPLLEARGAPPGLVRVVCRCLEKRPDDRFQSARDLGFALRTIAAMGSGSQSMSAVRLPLDSGAWAAQIPSGDRSIAVLPFSNMSADPETEYFSDGMTEEIINALSQLKELRVAARTSSFAFKGRQVEIAEVARKLNVDSVLEGSVRRAGNRLRITAQLVNVADGYHMWSERYDREMDDVFAIQDDIATNIARKLEVTLSGGGERLVKPSTEALQAYDLYLKGRFYVEQRGEGVARGLEFFHRALALDPDFALAYAGVAEALALMVIYGVVSPAEVVPKARAAAERALTLDEGLVEAHNVMALVATVFDWDWEKAHAEYRCALELNPGFVPARYHYSLLYLQFVRGKSEAAIEQGERAVELDPLATLPLYSLGLVLVCAGRFDEAIERMKAGILNDPNSFLLHRVLGVAYASQEKYTEGIEALEKSLALSGRHPWILSDLGAIYAQCGREEDAERLQQEMVLRAGSGVYTSPVARTVIPVALGRFEEAYEHLDEALEEHDPLLLAMRSWPIFGRIAGDERFEEVFRRIGLTD